MSSSNSGFINSLGMRTSYLTNLGNNRIPLGESSGNFPNFYNALVGSVPATVVVHPNGGAAVTITLPPAFSGEAMFNSWMGSLSNVNAIPNTMSGFAQAFKDYVTTRFSQDLTATVTAAVGSISSYTLDSSFTNRPTTDLTAQLVADYAQKLNVSTDFTGVLSPSSGDINNQALAWFTDFVTKFPYPANSAGLSSSGFFNTMGVALTTYAAIQSESVLSDFTSSTNVSSALPYDSSDFLRFETVFSTLFPSGISASTGKTFDQTLQDFYATYYNPQTGVGYFNPSQTFAFWVDRLQSEYNAGPPPSEDTSSLASAGASKTRVLNQILGTIRKLTDAVQDTAKYQSDRLLVYNSWQQAYIKLTTEIPVFTSGNPVSDATLGFTARGELNSDVNARYRIQIQSEQSGVSADSKALQAIINQSNDAISQQSKYATSIIQLIRDIIKVLRKNRK